jgi:hypothetical protein
MTLVLTVNKKYMLCYVTFNNVICKVVISKVVLSKVAISKVIIKVLL